MIAGILAGVIAVALAAAAVFAFLNPSSPADGTSAAGPKAPAPCSLVDRNLALKLVPEGTQREDGNLCSYEGKDPSAGPKLSLTVNAVPEENGKPGSEVASQHIKDTFKGVGKPVDGLGDESVSYEPPGSRTIIILFRVNDMIVSITGSGKTGTPETSDPVAPTKDVAMEVAKRLRK
jgi:hypothetical protein